MSNPARAEAASFICRCEELTREDLEAAIAAGARTISDVKRRTRAGMGACQGIYCLDRVAAMLAESTGAPPDEVFPMTSRPPARWITLSALAGNDE